MARTVSVETIAGSLIDDIDGSVVSDIEALRQRIVQAIRFRIRTWFLNRNSGLDYESIIGHRIEPALAAAAINTVIRNEGGAEVIELRDIEYSLDRETRLFRYSVNVETIYGIMPVTQTIG